MVASHEQFNDAETAARTLDQGVAEQLVNPDSNTLDYLRASYEELDEAARAISEVKRDPAVTELLKPLQEIGDSQTLEHSDRVALTAHVMGRRHGLTNEEVLLLDQASVVHDIGKAAPEIQVLVQSDKRFEGEEREQFMATMEKHPALGAEAVMNSNSWDQTRSAEVAAVALGHHAWKEEGSYGARPTQHQKVAQILALADTFDGLASKRGYKPAFEEAEVLDILAKEFDAEQSFINRSLGIQEQRRFSRTPKLPSGVVEYTGVNER
jgi:response regulator RpfG family c-di-GMP phosphodiesterase